MGRKIGKSLIAFGIAFLGIAFLVRQLYVADYNPCEKNSPLALPLIIVGFVLVLVAILIMVSMYYRTGKEKLIWGGFSVIAMVAVMYEYWMFYSAIATTGYAMYCAKVLH